MPGKRRQNDEMKIKGLDFCSVNENKRIKTSTFLLLVCLFCLPIDIVKAQTKAIAVVVDNSSSMFGRQMENAVFSVQMINSLKDEQDVLGVFVGGERISSESTSVSEQNKSFLTVSHTEGRSLCMEVSSTFSWLERYAKEGYRTELVILSDGELRLEPKRGVPFTCGKAFKNEFSNFFERTGTTVHFAKIISGGHVSNCSLCDAFQNVPVVRKYDIDVEKDRESLFQFLNRLSFNLSEASYKGRIPFESDGDRIIFRPEFPLSKFTVLFLDRESGEPLPSIQNARVEDSKQDLFLIDKSKASLESFEQPNWKNRNAHTPLKDKAKIWHLRHPENQVLKSGSSVEVTFSKEIEAGNIWIIPKTALTAVAYPGEGAVILDSAKSVYQICDDQETLQVYAQLRSADGNKFENDNLVNCRVKLKKGEEKYAMDYQSGGRFSVKVPIRGEEKQWFDVSLEYDAYFYFEPEIFSLEKVECGEVHTLRQSQTGLKDSVAIGALINKDTICSNLFQLVEPEGSRPRSVSDYEVVVLGKPPHTEVRVNAIDNETWEVCYFLDSDACECMYRSGMFTLSILFKSKILGKASYSLKENIHFVHSNPWYIRCLEEIIIFCLVIFIAFYLFLLIKKKRFPSRLRVVKRTGSGVKKTRTLKAGFFDRYLNPFGAETSNQFGYRFIAAGRKSNVVYLDKKNVKPKMNISGQFFDKRPNRNVLVYIQKEAIQYIDARGGKVKFDIQKF